MYVINALIILVSHSLMQLHPVFFSDFVYNISIVKASFSTFWLQLRSLSWDNRRHRHPAAALRDGFLKPTVDWIQVEIWFNLFEKSIGKIKLTQHHQSFVLSDLWGLPEFSICPTCFSSWRWTWGSKYEGVNIKSRWLKSRTTSDLLRLLVRFSLSSLCLQVDIIKSTDKYF